MTVCRLQTPYTVQNDYDKPMSTPSVDFVLKLPLAQRVQIVEEIWDSIADTAAHLPLQGWQAEELDRRAAEHQANPAEGVPWAEVRRKVMGAD